MSHRANFRLAGTLLLSILAIAAACTAPGSPVLGPGDRVPFPTDYRAWQHVKSMVIEPGHALHDAFGGIHHVYANPAALAGLRSGQYADGAVFAFDLLTATTGDHAITEGDRKIVGVMHHSAAAFPDTGGWGFAGFDGARHDVVKDMRSQCFSCHEPQRTKGFVYSGWRD